MPLLAADATSFSVGIAEAGSDANSPVVSTSTSAAALVPLLAADATSFSVGIADAGSDADSPVVSTSPVAGTLAAYSAADATSFSVGITEAGTDTDTAAVSQSFAGANVTAILKAAATSFSFGISDASTDAGSEAVSQSYPDAEVDIDVDTVDVYKPFTTKLDGNPFTLAVTGDGMKVYAVDIVDPKAWVFDTATNKLVKTLELPISKRWFERSGNWFCVGTNDLAVMAGDDPKAVAAEVGNRVYVANGLGGELLVIDCATDEMTSVQLPLYECSAVTVSRDDRRVYVAGAGDDSNVVVVNAADFTVSDVGIAGSPVVGFIVLDFAQFVATLGGSWTVGNFAEALANLGIITPGQIPQVIAALESQFGVQWADFGLLSVADFLLAVSALSAILGFDENDTTAADFIFVVQCEPGDTDASIAFFNSVIGRVDLGSWRVSPDTLLSLLYSDDYETILGVELAGANDLAQGDPVTHGFVLFNNAVLTMRSDWYGMVFAAHSRREPILFRPNEYDGVEFISTANKRLVSLFDPANPDSYWPGPFTDYQIGVVDDEHYNDWVDDPLHGNAIAIHPGGERLFMTSTAGYLISYPIPELESIQPPPPPVIDPVVPVVPGAVFTSELVAIVQPGNFSVPVPSWVSYVDVVALGGGAGGLQSASALPGWGGGSGGWATQRITPSGGSITGTVGSGGRGGSVSGLTVVTVQGGTETTVRVAAQTVTAAGGSTLAAGAANIPGVSTGNRTFNTYTYNGGVTVATPGGPGGYPGGGGCGGKSTLIGSSPGGAGANGKVWLRFYGYK